MRTNRFWLTSFVLGVTVLGCENRDPLAPVSGRLTRDPTDAYAKPLNSSSVQVNWTDSAPNEISFHIERSATGTGSWVTAGTTNRNVTSFDDGGRSSEQQVCYRVFAVFKNGLSNPSNTSCTVPPAAPTGLSATMVDHQAIDVAWTDNSAAEDGYYVERATAQAGPYDVVAFFAANTMSYRQSGLTTNTTYWYRVRAANDGGYSSYSNVASATPMFAAPNAPSALAVLPVSGHFIQLTWVDNSINEEGFRFERSLDAGATWTAVRTQGPNYTYAQDYGLSLEQSGCYRVFAYNAFGESVSNVDCTALPAAPTNLTANVTEGMIELRWADNSSVEDAYEVWRYAGNGGGYVLAATLPANATVFRDPGALPDQQYWYYVRAMRDGGTSFNSDIVTAVIATAPPNAPGNVFANPAWSSTALAVTWTDNSTNEAAFRIERSIDNGLTWISAGTTDNYWGNQFYDGGLTSEQPVCYRLFAFNAQGDSPSSNVFCTAPPAPATDLTATWTPEGIVLNWSDNSSYEDTYEIVLWTVCSEQPDYWIASVPENTTTFSLGPINPWDWCGDYPWVYVVVTNDGGYGDFSNGVYTGAASTAAAAGARAPDASALIRRARTKP